MNMPMNDTSSARGDVAPGAALQVHALEHSVRQLARENHRLQVELAEALDLLDQIYGSRGWRALEQARRVRRRGS